jgi:hypothetical protein
MTLLYVRTTKRVSHKINFNKISFHEKLTTTKCKTEYFRLVKRMILY